MGTLLPAVRAGLSAIERSKCVRYTLRLSRQDVLVSLSSLSAVGVALPVGRSPAPVCVTRPVIVDDLRMPFKPT